MIQDTSFVVDVLRGRESACRQLDEMAARTRSEKLSSVTVLELYEGVRRTNRSADERRAVLDVLDSKTVIAADHQVMRRAGEISGTLFENGTPIDREDCIVAATALREDEPVLTGNAGHFERIPELDVVAY